MDILWGPRAGPEVALQCQKPNVAWRPRPARFFKSLKTYGLRLGLLGFNILLLGIVGLALPSTLMTSCGL